jgi:hypothetical protein
MQTLQSMTRTMLLATFALSVLVMQGCSVIYKTTGDVLVNYSEDQMVPYLMTSEDTAMGCATGESLTPLLMSFETVGSHPEKLGVLVHVVAGACAEQRATEQELRYLRAINEGDGTEAQDARAQQKRYSELAARRQYQAFKHVTSVYGEADNGQCPRLRSDFDSLVWMVGQLGGIQALLNDAKAETAVGVPRDIAAKAQRGAGCLDNEKWWGVPNAIRAALWNILPPLKPDGAEAWPTLEKSVEQGFEGGVRLSSALYATAARSVGDDERVRQAIREFYQRDVELEQDYRMLDSIAGNLILAISDRMWTKATGQRTPFGQEGKFWDDRSESSDVNIDDLL